MAKIDYTWKRFWAPRGALVKLDTDGFLCDPDSTYGRDFNPDLMSMSELLGIQCLILLGEPGIGKTHELNLAYRVCRATARDVGNEALFRDLRAYQTDAFLRQRIFESEEFLEWRRGTHHLHLFLDGLDECLLRIDMATNLLAQELKECPVGRLSLRLACRSAEWRHSFEEGLKHIFQVDPVSVYTLAPLRRVDVEAAVEREGLDVAEFMSGIQTSRSAPFAMKPVTLRMLMGIFDQQASFPLTLAEVYEKGCLCLASEPNESRLESKQLPRTPPELLLAVASSRPLKNPLDTHGTIALVS